MFGIQGAKVAVQGAGSKGLCVGWRFRAQGLGCRVRAARFSGASVANELSWRVPDLRFYSIHRVWSLDSMGLGLELTYLPAATTTVTLTETRYATSAITDGEFPPPRL